MSSKIKILKNHKQDEKRNVIIFVRVRIIHSVEDYQKVTQAQEEAFEEQSPADNLDEALKLAK